MATLITKYASLFTSGTLVWWCTTTNYHCSSKSMQSLCWWYKLLLSKSTGTLDWWYEPLLF